MCRNLQLILGINDYSNLKPQLAGPNHKENKLGDGTTLKTHPMIRVLTYKVKLIC